MSPTRRAYLHSGITAGLGALTGCANRSADSSTETDGTPALGTNSGPFRDLSFEGGELVVALAPEHGLSSVNLIAPDGTIFEQVPIATGVRTVRVPVLDPQPDDGGYRHYTPGVHELIGVDAEGEEVGARAVPMQPNLAISGVKQYRESSRPVNFGSLVFTIENRGTAPTWIHDITYQDAPHGAANLDVAEMPGVLSVRTVPEGGALLVPPNGSKSYRDVTSPLIFDGADGVSCNGGVTFSALIATATGEILKTKVAGTIAGESLPVGLVDEYACSVVDITITSDSAAPTTASIHTGEL